MILTKSSEVRITKREPRFRATLTKPGPLESVRAEVSAATSQEFQN